MKKKITRQKKGFLLILPLLLIAAVSGYSGFLLPQSTGDEANGIWLTGSKESMIEISKTGNTYVGKLFWLKIPNDPATGKPKLDTKNPEPKLRSRPILGLTLMQDFKFDASSKEWSGGTIYDPKSGSTYHCKASLPEKNTLKVRGYIGASWMGLGRTESWSRIK